MKAESNIRPISPYEIEVIEDEARIKFFENIIDISTEEDTRFEWDEYTCTIKNRANLNEAIELNYNTWLNWVKSNLISQVKSDKISEMNQKCQDTIVSGIDVILSDGQSHHFDLTIEDQLNIASLKEMVAAGVQQIPYHEKGHLCQMYSPEDIMLILNQATTFKTYNVTYFNSLKSYINSLNDVNIISAIEYGITIPIEYCSDVLLSML